MGLVDLLYFLKALRPKSPPAAEAGSEVCFYADSIRTHRGSLLWVCFFFESALGEVKCGTETEGETLLLRGIRQEGNGKGTTRC